MATITAMRTLITLIIGFLLGVAFGAMFAQRTGKELREQAKEKGTWDALVGEMGAMKQESVADLKRSGWVKKLLRSLGLFLDKAEKATTATAKEVKKEVNEVSHKASEKMKAVASDAAERLDDVREETAKKLRTVADKMDNDAPDDTHPTI